MDESRPPPPSGRDLAWRYAVHVVLCLAIGAAIWHHQLPWLSPDPQDVQRYLPLGFAFETALLLALAAGLRPAQVSLVLALDLAGWVSLPAAVVATHIAAGWYGGWLTGAVAVKLIPLLWALVLRVRSGLGDRLTALAVASTFLVSSVIMLPYTRFSVPSSVGVTGDEPHFLTVSANLLAGGGFWVGKAYFNGIAARVYGAPLPLSLGQVVRTATGHYASGHDLGVPLLALPFYALGGTKAVMIAWALIAALAVYETHLLIRATRVAPVAAVTATVLAAFSLPFLPEATQVSPEIPLACCAVVAARRLFARSPSRADIVTMGLALAVMPWLQVRAWPIVIPLLVAALVTWRSRFAWIVLLGVVAVSTAAYWSLLYSIYGEFIVSPVTLQPGLQHLPHLSLGQVVGALISILMDPVSGLVPNAPVWLLGLGGLFLLARRSVAGAATTVAIVLYIGFVGASTLRGTTQGYGPPGRFAVVLVPLLAPALGLAWERVTGRWWSEVRWALVAWTVVYAFAVQAVRVLTYGTGLTSALAGLIGFTVPTLDQGHTPWLLLGLLVVLVAIVVLAIHAVPLPRSERREVAAST